MPDITSSQAKLGILAASFLIFSCGFASGYYYLDSKAAAGVITIEDKGADCSMLFEKGLENGVSPGQAGDDVSGSVLSASGTDEAGDAQASAEGQFAASKNSTLYHTRDCQYVKRIKSENLVWFRSEKEAQESRKPHSCVK